MTLPRRLLGTIKTAILWAGAWAVAGSLLLVGLWVRGGKAPPLAAIFWQRLGLQILLWASWGALSGAVFALLVVAAERRRTLEELSPVRTAIWGAIGGMALPLATYATLLLPQRIPLQVVLDIGVVTLAGGALGAVMAGGSLGLARRLPPGQPSPKLGPSAT